MGTRMKNAKKGREEKRENLKLSKQNERGEACCVIV